MVFIALYLCLLLLYYYNSVLFLFDISIYLTYTTVVLQLQRYVFEFSKMCKKIAQIEK